MRDVQQVFIGSDSWANLNKATSFFRAECHRVDRISLFQVIASGWLIFDLASLLLYRMELFNLKIHLVMERNSQI